MKGALLSFFGILMCSAAHAEILIENVLPGEVVHHPLLMLRGKASGPSIKVSLDSESPNHFPIVRHEFKAIVDLKPGKNMVILEAGSDRAVLRVDFAPPASPLKVLAVWIKAKDEREPYFLNPGNTPKYKEKFGIAMKMIQSFYAEAMKAGGYGRKTFPLELDQNGDVVIRVITVPKTGKEMRAMEPNASWGYIYGQVQKQFDPEKTKWCTMLAFSDYDPETKKASGHYALGGGALGAFGSGSMQFWPSSLSDVVTVLMDKRPLDLKNEFDDSAYRSTVWANVATAWGAMAHEMGHTFGLPHSNDPFSVMSRGFDYFNRVFTVEEPPTAREKANKTYSLKELAHWDLYSAAKLNWNPFLQADYVIDPNAQSPSISIEGDDVILRAPSGIRVWGVDTDDLTPVFTEHLKGNAPQEVKASVKELSSRLGAKGTFRLTVIDSNGKQITKDIKL